MTAGYYNTNQNNAYLQISKVFKKCHASFDFTCLEMKDSNDCGSRPQQLVKQAILASHQEGSIIFNFLINFFNKFFFFFYLLIYFFNKLGIGKKKNLRQ